MISLIFTVCPAKYNRVIHPIINTHWLRIHTGLLYAEFWAAVGASGLVSHRWDCRVSPRIDHDRQQFQGNNTEWGNYSCTANTGSSPGIQSPNNTCLAPHLCPGIDRITDDRITLPLPGLMACQQGEVSFRALLACQIVSLFLKGETHPVWPGSLKGIAE